jgi:hypothetical protein
MANPDDPRESSESQILTHTLLKLRMHEGLAPARLQRDHRNTAPLLNLPAVQLLAVTNDIEAPEAALEVVRRCVRQRGGFIYAETDSLPGTFRRPTFSSLSKESSLARNAFCAALAAQLLEHDESLTPEVARWATAAMACAAEGFGRPESVTDCTGVQRRLATLSV